MRLERKFAQKRQFAHCIHTSWLGNKSACETYSIFNDKNGIKGIKAYLSVPLLTICQTSESSWRTGKHSFPRTPCKQDCPRRRSGTEILKKVTTFSNVVFLFEILQTWGWKSQENSWKAREVSVVRNWRREGHEQSHKLQNIRQLWNYLLSRHQTKEKAWRVESIQLWLKLSPPFAICMSFSLARGGGGDLMKMSFLLCIRPLYMLKQQLKKLNYTASLYSIHGHIMRPAVDDMQSDNQVIIIRTHILTVLYMYLQLLFLWLLTKLFSSCSKLHLSYVCW